MLSDTHHLKAHIARLEAENDALRQQIEILHDTIAELQPTPPPWQDEALIIQVKRWLGEKGVEFFSGIRDRHDGSLNVVTLEKGVPHPVHFREGMMVRNYLRQITNGAWSDWEYDDHWADVVLEAIK